MCCQIFEYNFDVGTITRDAIDIAHGIITDCLLFDPMQVELLYVGGGCCCCWSLIFICKVGFYVSVSVEREKEMVSSLAC